MIALVRAEPRPALSAPAQQKLSHDREVLVVPLPPSASLRWMGTIRRVRQP